MILILRMAYRLVIIIASYLLWLMQQILPAFCGSRINYDKYSTDKTKFSVGFASPLGQLLPCNHIYNQYIFIDDAAKDDSKTGK